MKDAQTVASSVDRADRLAFARSMTYRIVRAYVETKTTSSNRVFLSCELPFEINEMSGSLEEEELALTIGKAAAQLDVVHAGYMIGTIYTGLMPRSLRSRLGAHYTPPALCDRLLDMATEAGVDWRSARVLDPACGGGAFLPPIARRIAASLQGADPKTVLDTIQQNLMGVEIDPFAAWMSEVFLDVTLEELGLDFRQERNSVVRVCDTLERLTDTAEFDLVVGNPPYGRIKLSAELRARFERSLFGHANLYGLFTDVALRLTKQGGVIAYVTPTSFLSGEYFKALRSLLAGEAPPICVGFVDKRKGIFADVLQETLLATYRRGKEVGKSSVHFLAQSPNGEIETSGVEEFVLPRSPGRPWLIPRTKRQGLLLGQAANLPYRISDYGYSVSTGPLVWNRHKDSLRVSRTDGSFPLVWAESVRKDGTFEFCARNRNHKPYFEPKDSEFWVVTQQPCVLLQRTTAKEQNRRLFAAELPTWFIKQHGGAVVENHLNMLRSNGKAPVVAPRVLTVLLNSDVVDQVFRCISGSVAVSAYEINALPLPSPLSIVELEQEIKNGTKGRELENLIEDLYVKEVA